MLVKLIDKDKQCGFGLKDGACGKPSIVTIGNTPICREHFEYAVDLMPMEFRLGYPAVPPVNKMKLRPARKSDFIKAVAEWDEYRPPK